MTMEISDKETDVMIIAELKKDFYAQEELNLLLMFVMKNAEIEGILVTINVTMGTLTVWMVVMGIVMWKLDGFASEEILEELSPQLTFVQRFAETGSIEVGIHVMMEICKMEMDVQQTVSKNLASDVLEEMLKL